MTTLPLMLFRGGQVVATAAACEVLSPMTMIDLLSRHMTGDWGELDPEDKASNDKALLCDERILSSYTTDNGIKVRIITEADHSVTTILLPSDYRTKGG